MKPHLTTLSNGLRVLLVDTKTYPTLTALLLVGAGSRYENKDNNGIAHFLEHMFYKGSVKYRDPEIISQTIEGMGGYWNAFTSKDYTGYFIKASTDHFEKMTDILADLLLHSLFKTEEITKEKGVIVEEINMYEDMPQRKIGDIFEKVMYDGNPLGFEIAGSKEIVNKFTRNTFVDYMQSLYYPNNTVLVVAGGLNRIKNKELRIKNYLEVIEKKLGGWKKGEKKQFELFTKTFTKPQIYIHHKKTEQAHYCLGYPTFGIGDERRPALKVLATILGGGASSRLFQEVREKRGLCYYISTSLEQFYETGNIVTQAGVAKDPSKVKDAVQATIKEHLKIAGGQVREADIARSKEMLRGRLLLSLEDSFNIAHLYGLGQLHENKIESPEERIAKIMRVTKDEIVRLARELFTGEKLNFAIIGPFADGDIHIDL